MHVALTLEQQLARRVRERRKACGFTLDQLAEASGVSRSMISLIEREETSPTAAVLGKLATALGLSLAALFAEPERDDAESPLATRAQQPEWTDPESGYLRRQVSPTGYASAIDLVEVSFPAGARVHFDHPSRQLQVHQLLWMLEGEMELTVGQRPWRLRSGDCLAMALDQPITFHNPTRKVARYAVAVTTLPNPLGSPLASLRSPR